MVINHDLHHLFHKQIFLRLQHYHVQLFLYLFLLYILLYQYHPYHFLFIHNNIGNKRYFHFSSNPFNLIYNILNMYRNSYHSPPTLHHVRLISNGFNVESSSVVAMVQAWTCSEASFEGVRTDCKSHQYSGVITRGAWCPFG